MDEDTSPDEMDTALELIDTLHSCLALTAGYYPSTLRKRVEEFLEEVGAFNE